MNFKLSKIVFAGLLAISLASCATRSSNIEASYVSSSKYGNKSCSKLETEFVEIGNRVKLQSKKQDKKADGDAVAAGIGAILFWPSLFFIKGDGANAKVLSELKGEYDAIKAAAKNKNCKFIADFEAAEAEAKLLAKEKKKKN